VSTSELYTILNIALGNVAPTLCPEFNDRTPTPGVLAAGVDDLLAAMNIARHDCGAPTPTAAGTPVVILRLPSEAVGSGDSLPIPVAIDGGHGIVAGVQLDIVSSVVSGAVCEIDPRLDGSFVLATSQPSPGVLRLIIAPPTSSTLTPPLTDGVVAWCWGNVPSDEGPVPVDVDNVVVADAAGRRLTVIVPWQKGCSVCAESPEVQPQVTVQSAHLAMWAGAFLGAGLQIDGRVQTPSNVSSDLTVIVEPYDKSICRVAVADQPIGDYVTLTIPAGQNVATFVIRGGGGGAPDTPGDHTGTCRLLATTAAGTDYASTDMFLSVMEPSLEIMDLPSQILYSGPNEPFGVAVGVTLGQYHYFQPEKLRDGASEVTVVISSSDASKALVYWAPDGGGSSDLQQQSVPIEPGDDETSGGALQLDPLAEGATTVRASTGACSAGERKGLLCATNDDCPAPGNCVTEPSTLLFTEKPVQIGTTTCTGCC
jgi:hypothetical protein